MRPFFNKLLTRLMWIPGALFNEAMYRSGRWRRYDQVDEHVLVGALPNGDTLSKLKAEGVTLIVNLCEEHSGETARLSQLGLTQLHLPTLDRTPPSRASIDRALEAIGFEMARGGRTYVHCRAGKGRSALVAVCHLIAHGKLEPKDAYEKLRQIRPQINRDLHETTIVQQLTQR